MADEFREVLEDLKENNKLKINLLTMLAEENQDAAVEIADTIENRMLGVSKEHKLPILYVADSILKNVRSDVYKKEFKRIILNCFVNAFQATLKSDAKSIKGDEKIRASLYNLRRTWGDIFPKSKLYELDIEVKKIDPAWPLAGAMPAASTAPVGASVHVNPRFIGSRPANPPIKKPHAVPPTAAVPPTRQVLLKDKTPPAHPPTIPQQTKLKSILKEVKPEPMDEVSTDLEDPSPPPNKRLKSPPQPIVKSEPMDTSENMRKKRPFNGNRNFSKNTSASPPIITPTAAPGAHAFVTTPMQPLAPQKTIAPSNPFGATPFQQPGSTPFTNMPPPSFPATAQTPMPMGPPITNTYAQPMHPPHMDPPFQTPQFVSEDPSQALSTPSSSRPPAVISHDVVKLEGVPANNRIFVDGKAHEVFYVDNTAVIERNGLPHRIYFSGPPKNVIIDGVQHILQFGETKTVLIDGEEHRIRFGAPSRELIMGDFPFKGAFGGAPIFATINSVRHEIRLGGPPPEVKIEPTPCYELSRFLPNLRKNQPVSTPQQPKKEEQGNHLAALLNSVKNTLANSQARAATKRSSPPIDSTPPTPTARGPERRRNPPNLQKFNLPSLRIRYDSVIDAIHSKRQCCSHCGIRVDQFKGDKYRKHLDWHIKKNLRLLDNVSKSRLWYMDFKTWTHFSGVEEDETEEEETKKTEAQPKVRKTRTADTESRCCASCSLEFKREFDEEEETWTLQDCVMVNGKTYHQQCLLDASSVEEPQDRGECIKGEPDLDLFDIKHLKADA